MLSDEGDGSHILLRQDAHACKRARVCVLGEEEETREQCIVEVNEVF